MGQCRNRIQSQLKRETPPKIQALRTHTQNPIRPRIVENISQTVGYEYQVANTEPGLCQHDADVNSEAADSAADGEGEVAEGGDLGEREVGVETAAGFDEKHHAVVGEKGDGEEHKRAEEPAGLLEGVREAEDAGADDGDEDVGEGLGRRGQVAVFEEERGVFARERWEGFGGGGYIGFVEHDHGFDRPLCRGSKVPNVSVSVFLRLKR